jgi:hypothetical protein
VMLSEHRRCDANRQGRKTGSKKFGWVHMDAPPSNIARTLPTRGVKFLRVSASAALDIKKYVAMR